MSEPDPREVVDRIGALRLVPVVVVLEPKDAPVLGSALKAGGVRCAEIAFRTSVAGDALRAMAEDPEMLVGAGTVLRPAQVDEALAAGAKFIVTPGFSREVVSVCQQAGIPVFPGVATATEIQMALESDIHELKFFPSEALGGATTLTALAAPFPMVRFIPTGGIARERLPSYAALPYVLAVGGSWMVAPGLVAERRFDEVSRLTAEAVAVVQKCRTPEVPGTRK